MAESQLRTLYESLRRDNYDVPDTYESFERTLTAPGQEGTTNRQTLYNSLHKDGYDVPDTYESFANTLFVPQPKQQTAPAPQAVAEAPAPTQKTQTTAKDTAPVQKAQPQVQTQTRPTSQQPTGTVVAFKLRRGGHDFYVTQQEVNEAGGLGAWAAKHPGAPVRVYMHGDGFTGHVDLSEASKRRKEKGYKYTLEYRPGHKVKRNKSGWVDNLVEYGQETKAIEEMTAPTKQVVEQLWSAAEKKQTTDARNNYDALNNKWSRTGDDMPFVDSSVRYLANETDRMKNFDLDKMSEEAWRRSGAALTQKVYQRLKLANPKADDNKLIEQAEAEAWRLTNKAVYDYAVEKNMPKSVLEYFFKKVMDQNSVVSLLRGTARSMAATTGDQSAYEAAQEEYGKKHKVASVASTVVGMGADPMMTLTGGAGGAAGKAVLNVGGRLIAGKAAGTAVETGTRLFANKLGAKVAAGVASGSVNLGMYEGLKEGERQFLHGGYINPETGQNEGYSLRAMFESAGKGAILGAATGVISPIFGNVGNKLVGKADRISSTGGGMAAKAGIRATQHLVATGLEGTIFATEGWLTTDEDKMDVWLDSMATMIGFKGHHIIKSAPRVIAGMRPVKPTADRPLTMDERNFNRKSFVERVSAMLDGPKFADERRNGNGMPLSFTKEDISALKEAGYGSLADIFRSDRAKEADKPFEERVLDALGEDESTAEMSNGSGGLLDGYSEMEKLVKDASVPQEIRAKAYYALTGHCLGAGTITGHTTRETDDGRIVVDALTNNGEIVYRRFYKSKDATKAATEKLDRQIELNKIDVGEQYADAVADETILDDVIKAQYPDNNPEDIKKIYYGVKYGKARADEHLRKGIDAIDKEIATREDEAADMRPDAIRKAYGEEYGVDIDDAIRKPSGDRSEAEKRAVESYIARLFASGETRVDRYDSKSDSYVSDVADAADVAETQAERQPIGRATMKFQDRPVEVLSGRVVMTEDGKMVDVERSDKTIVVRDPATGKTEMVSPEAMLSYEDVAPEVAADEWSMPKYSSGSIMILDNDGKERRGFLTGDVDDLGRYEYYLAGDLNHLFYATEEELDNRVTKFVPDRRNDVADVSDVADEKQNEVSVSMPTGVEAIGAVDVAQSDGYGRRFNVGRNENGELVVVDERGYMWAHDGNGQRMEPYQPGANVPVWTEEQLSNLGVVQLTNEQSVTVPNLPENVPTFTETSQNPTESAISSAETVPNPENPVDNAQGAPNQAAELTPLQRIPRDEKGEPIFELAETPEIAWDALVEFSDGDVADAKEMADIVSEQKRKALEKFQKQKPKGASLAELRESQKVIKAAREQAEQEYNFWQQMAGVEQLRQEAEARRHAEERAEADRAEAEEKKRKAALDKRLHDTYEEVKDVPEAVEVLEDMDPRDIYEAAAQLLSGQKVLWGDAGVKVGARSETGFGEEERRRLFGLFASEANGGKSLSRLAEDAMKQQCEAYGIPYDNQDARNALIDVISGARTVGDIRNYIANNRIDEARRLAEAKRRHEEEQYDEFCRQEYHLSAEEVEAYEDQLLAELSERDIEFDANEYNDYIADEMARAAEITEQQKNGTEDNDTRRGSTPGDRRVQENDTEGKGTVSGRGYEVLPESRADQSSGAATDGDRSGIQPADGVQGDGPASAVAQGAQRGGIAAVGRRKADDSPYGGLAEEVTSAIGPFGKIYTQFIGKPREAVTFLLAKRDGEAIGALHHKDVGEIDLVWGEEGSAHSDGFGLAKLAKYHPEVLFNLQEILNDMAVTKRSANRVQLESEKYKAAVRLTWDNQKKTWLLTMFEKKNSALDNTTDTDKTHKGNGNDTATPENTVVSDRKDNDFASDKQASGEESLPQLSDDKRKPGLQEAVEAASAEVNTEPTEAQKKAGNYKKGHVTIGSFDITIENPAGSVRRGVDADGKEWSTTMANAYGEIRGTQSVDGDPIDVFLATDMDAWNGRKVFVVDQTNADGSFDEHKVMLGFNDNDEAMAAYLANYDKTWADTHPGLRITEANIEDFQKWVESSHRKTKAFADYSMVKGTAEAVARRQKDEAELRTERPERGANYDRLKSDLVGFAKKFKDAGTANITAVEREISEWMSKQSAEDLADVDSQALAEVCNEAGLDKGKAWAFRMSIDHSTPKELIEEVFKIRNVRRKQIAPRGIADVDGFDILNPESQAVVQHYLSQYGSKPIRVIVDMNDIVALGFPKEVNEAFEEVLNEGGIPAVYNHYDKKIYIFANVFNSARRHDGDLFHENVHGAIDECESYPEELLSSFRRKVVSSGYKAARFQGLESMLKKEYDEDSVDEEFLAYTLQWMFDRSDRESRIMELLSDEEKEFINNNILNKIRYAQRRRTSESASEESKGHETLHASRQRAGGGDGAWISRKATDGDERRGSQGVAGESASDERSEHRRYAIGVGTAEAPAQGKNAESGGDETARIEDFGEKIAGARKDMLRDVAKSVENVTEQSLIELPLGKAFKRPNLKKMVDGGVISDDDASLAEAVMQGLVYAKNKPVATRSPRRQREIKEWAKETYEGIRLLGEILSGDPARRDKALEERKARQAEKLAEVNRHIDNLREWNPGKEFSYLTELPDEVEVVSRVLKGIGHKVGEKTNLPLCRLEVSSTGKGYTITGPGKQGALWFKKYHNTVDEAIETMIFAARLARGDRDVEIPGYYLSVKGVGRPRMELTGKYEVVYWAKNGKDIKTKLFSGKKEAEEFATAHSGKVTEQQRYVNEYESYTVTVKNPLTGNSLPIGGGSTERVELIAMMDEQHDELNALAVEAIAKETGTKSAPRDHFFVATTWERGKIIYSIVSTDKNNPWPIVKDFATRKEAEAWYGANRERLEAERRQRMESEKSVVYFETGVHRRGKDHRSGRHATPEMYDEQFGFRGVQFGNWTNDTDRQMAMDQAYDALMDLSEQLGISPRAMSLYGELGLAFGARGCGNASAHYEPVQVVINLTKTKGAGSLAHEWWHALDNYLSRRAGVALGHATHGHGSDKMDPDVASAVARLMEAVLSSQYGKRSLAKGEYWGRPTEMGARLFETWISERIKAEGNRSPFLVSGISQNAIDLFHSLNYLVYRSNEARVAEREKREPHYMSKEEFIKTPEALNGYPYPVIGELEALSPSLENLFNILRENERTDGMMAKESRRRYGRAKRPTMTGRTLFDWADDEARAQRDTPAKDERDIAADDANAALDEYAEAYNDYLERTENLEAQLEAEGVDETLRAILREQADAEETMLLEGRDRLRESLRQYYVRENTPEDAERITRDMVSRLEAEIEVRRRGKSVLADILEERTPAEGTAQPTNEARTSQVKTAGGYLTYQAQGHLPDAREGEFAYVERQFSRTGEFSFTGSDRIIDRGDVAYIFRSLEDYSNENVFAVLVKHGHAKIIHIGMGGPTSSVADMGAIRAGVDAFGADKIYLVHNHPSGNLNPSEPDRRLVRALETAFGSDIKTEGIIMDTTSGRYTTFDSLRRTETFDRRREESSTNTGHEVYRLNHADRSGMPENIVQIKSPQDVKTFLGNLRFGGVKKVSYLILSTNHEIIGHFHTGYTTLEDAGLAEEIASVAEKFGGTTVVVYGNMEIPKSLGLKEALKNKSLNTITLLDVVGMRGGIHRSAIDEGVLREESEPYGSLTEVREPMARETSPQNIGKNVTENESLSAIRALKPIKIERNSMSREELFAKYKSLPTVNKDGNKIRFLRTAFGKNYKEGGLFAQISPRLNDVLSSAVLAYSEKDSLGGTTRPDGTKHKTHPNVLSFDNYVNKVSIENCEYYVRMTVQNTVDNTTGLHSCFVSDINLYENTATGRTDSAISRRPNDSFSGIVDAKLQQFFERASSAESKKSHGMSEGENGVSDEADSQDYALGDEGVIHYRKSADIDAEYPNWLDGTTTESGKHSTQVEGTRKTYGKLGSWIEASLGKDVSILDASSGMGYGTKDLRERGFNIEDVEPYQSEQRKAENPATYDSYSKIEKQYDYIISNAVLNVVPDDWRTDVLHDMAGRLKVGGRLFINTRKAGEEKSIKDKIELDSPREILVRRNGKISSYQRFFTPKELKEWVEKELGDGYEVEVANERNSGTNGLAAVVVTKTIATRPDLEMPEAKRSHAEKLAKKFNTPITIVDDVEKLPAAMRNKKGGYDVRNGNVIVVIPNHANVEDVAETVFHEVVAHKGLREMLGEENYDAFCDEIYGHLKDDLKRQIDTEAGRRFMREPEKGYEHHRRVAVDELFGRMAEKGFEDFTKAERGIWAKLKAKVLEAINKFLGSLKLPKWVRLGDNELRYILWRSHERLGGRAKAQGQVQNGALDFVDMARDAAKRAELGLNKSDVIVTRSRKTTADRIEESFDAAVAGELTGKPVEIGRLTKEGREYLEKLSGLKLKETVSFVLNPSDLVHMYRDHFGTNEKDKGNNVPLTKEDIRAIADVVSSPERVIFGKEPDGLKRNLFYFLAPAQEGAYNLLEIYGDRKGNLTAKTFYKTRKGVSQRVLSLMKSEHLTSVTDGATLSDGAKLPKFFDNSISGHEMIEYRFRESETGDIWKDQSLGLKEKITYAALRLSKAQADDMTLRNDAMAAIGDNLKNLLHDMRNRRGTTQKFASADHKVEANIAKAKAAQLRYDRSTVKRVGDIARILMQTGYLSDMTSGEILRLMSAVKNSVGGNDIESSVDKIMDIMIGNQLRNAEDALHSLLSIRGSKVDSRGVEVQGELDIDGQRTIEVVKRTINLNEDNITSLMDDARDRMGDSDKIIADNAAIEYAGLNMALDYAQNIANSKAEEAALRYDLKTANEDMKVGRLTENAYKQLVDSIDEAIRKNKIERAEAYFNLVGRLSDSLRESIENAKAFRNAEKARVREIQHNANSDMEGRPSNEHHKDDWKDKMANNGFVQFVLAPLGTFDQILRTFGNKSANGEGYLWNRFMRGWVDCRNKELLGVKNKFARLDEKVAEIFGAFAKTRGDSKKGPKVKSMADMIKLDGKLPTATVKFWDGGEMREHELTQGNLLYIYMVDKMTDGRMKLRRMGITEEDIANVEKALDPRFKEFGDWLQEEFLVDTRNEYNETHKRIFGASMAAVENYFPLKILSNARTDKEEDVNQQGRPDGITTKTGSIIKRRTNSLALDIIGSNALSVVLDHITEMEHWNAYAEWNRDLNTLRTYKRFRNQVMNMTTAYGGGERLWKRFNDLCLMGAGEYRPPIAMLDKAAVNIAKGVTAAKVSFRIFTALKQFLSAPAYIPEVSTASIAKSLANPYGDFKWCLENLPIFYERWHSRISGDPRLLKTDHDWKTWREGIVAVAARLGMTPNAFVDALTVSIGARAMYQARLKRYIKEGYASEEAENRAKQDATILFNQTQQSSESPFLSTMQVDRSWLSVLFTVFRNSSMSYTRQEYDALRNLKRNLTPGQRAKSIEFMTKQILRDWDIDPDTATDAERNLAQSAAKKRFRRQLKKDVVRLATFGFILQLAWNLGAYLPYIIFGDDDNEKGKMWDDALTHSYFGSVEGLTGGDVISSFGNMWASGEWSDRQLTKDMPLASDISTIIKKFVGEKNTEAINDIINLAIQSGIGVNPQSITDVVVAITDACGDDPQLSHEAAICIMRILQVPQSQLDKMYFDEVGLSGREISQYTPGQLAQRYAEYKIMRGTPFVPWMWGDEEQQSKYEKSAQKKIKERLAGREDDEVVATYEDLDDRYKSFTKKIGAVKEMMGTDYIAAAQEAAELQNDPDFKIYQKRNALDAALDKAMRKWPPQRRERVKDLRLESTVAGVPQSKLAIKASEQKKVSLTGELNRIANKYFTAETPEEARLIADTMAKYRALIVDAMQTDSEAEQEAAISELSTLIHDFRTKEEEMRSTKR